MKRDDVKKAMAEMQEGMERIVDALNDFAKAQQALALAIVAEPTAPPAPVKQKPQAPQTFSEIVAFKLAKGLALRALSDQAKLDPENSWVTDLNRLVKKAHTVEELDSLLKDEHEDDWLEGYVQARVPELLDAMMSAITTDEEEGVQR